MHKLLTGLALSLSLLAPNLAQAQEAPAYDEAPTPKQQTQTRARRSEAEMLIFQRAVARAKARTQRIAAKRLIGYSPQRPVMARGVNPFIYPYPRPSVPFSLNGTIWYLR